jgi:hypothetical protein
MATPLGTDDTPPPGGEEKSNGGKDGAEPKMITEEEFARRMRGKAAEAERASKALEAAQAKLAKLEADAKAQTEAALAEQGKWKELAEQRAQALKDHQSAIKEREEKIAAYEAKEQTRLEEIATRNKERIKALPDDIRKDVPRGLDPESLASVLSTIEKLIPGDSSGGGVFSSGPKPRANASPTQDLDQANKLFGDLQMRRAAPGGVRR